MGIPTARMDPPFRITRASHVVLTVADLARSRAFYCEAIGLVVTDETPDALYLRGVEEACHHSLVLKRASGPRRCERVGLRVASEDDLERAHREFRARELPAAFVEVPGQVRTLHALDASGMPLELAAHMETQPRAMGDVASYRGAAALRMDHFQILVPDVPATAAFYAELGFRVSDYIEDDETGDLLGVFMFRKNNPHDLVFFRRSGPALHHFGYIIAEASHMFRACDIAGAMGLGDGVERGPGRHGLGHSLYVYLRDPDGHRIELLPAPIQLVDLEEQPNRWSASNGFSSVAWGLPAQRRWFEEVTPFAGARVTDPPPRPAPMTLERYLAERA